MNNDELYKTKWLRALLSMKDRSMCMEYLAGELPEVLRVWFYNSPLCSLTVGEAIDACDKYIDDAPFKSHDIQEMKQKLLDRLDTLSHEDLLEFAKDKYRQLFAKYVNVDMLYREYSSCFPDEE